MPKVKNLAPLLVRAETLNRSVLDNLGCFSCDTKGLLALTDYLGQAKQATLTAAELAGDGRNEVLLRAVSELKECAHMVSAITGTLRGDSPCPQAGKPGDERMQANLDWIVDQLEHVQRLLESCRFKPRARSHLQNCVLTWRFHEAPESLRALSNGGDDDWLSYVSPSKASDYFPWMESGSSFGCCHVQQCVLPDGGIVYIGSHS